MSDETLDMSIMAVLQRIEAWLFLKLGDGIRGGLDSVAEGDQGQY